MMCDCDLFPTVNKITQVCMYNELVLHSYSSYMIPLQVVILVIAAEAEAEG